MGIIMPIYTENTNGIDNTYNCCMNIENRINNFRISNNDKIQFLNLNQKKKYNPNKNVLKYILINSNNQQNAGKEIMKKNVVEEKKDDKREKIRKIIDKIEKDNEKLIRRIT